MQFLNYVKTFIYDHKGGKMKILQLYNFYTIEHYDMCVKSVVVCVKQWVV